MSYGCAAALQEAVYGRLAADDALRALVGPAIYDAVPPGTPPGTFVVVGPEEVADRSDATGAVVEHRLQISVISALAGFHQAKEVAAAVSDALLAAPIPDLRRGRVVGTWFQRATAMRMRQGGARRIDLFFRILVED
jgi:hypothetical protein